MIITFELIKMVLLRVTTIILEIVLYLAPDLFFLSILYLQIIISPLNIIIYLLILVLYNFRSVLNILLLTAIDLLLLNVLVHYSIPILIFLFPLLSISTLFATICSRVQTFELFLQRSIVVITI